MIGWVVIGALFISGLKDLGTAVVAAISCVLSLVENTSEKNETTL